MPLKGTSIRQEQIMLGLQPRSCGTFDQIFRFPVILRVGSKGCAPAADPCSANGMLVDFQNYLFNSAAGLLLQKLLEVASAQTMGPDLPRLTSILLGTAKAYAGNGQCLAGRSQHIEPKLGCKRIKSLWKRTALLERSQVNLGGGLGDSPQALVADCEPPGAKR